MICLSIWLLFVGQLPIGLQLFLLSQIRLPPLMLARMNELPRLGRDLNLIDRVAFSTARKDLR